MTINEEMLKQRMMRGALVGPAEKEKEPMAYCKGKQDNGKGCRILVLPGHDYCRRHQKEIDALVQGAPLEPGQMERIVGEFPETREPAPEMPPVKPFRLHDHPKAQEKVNSTLSRLIRLPPPVPEPLSATAIVLDFNLEEYEAIQAEKVTAEDLRSLSLMLIAGELCSVASPDNREKGADAAA